MFLQSYAEFHVHVVEGIESKLKAAHIERLRRLTANLDRALYLPLRLIVRKSAS